MARYIIPTDYIYNNNNDQILDNICTIFKFLAYKTNLILDPYFMYYTEIKYYRNMFMYLNSKNIEFEYNSYKKLITEQNLTFISYPDILHYLYENC